MKTLVYKLRPAPAQAALFDETLETCRRLYNHALAERKTAYQERGDDPARGRGASGRGRGEGDTVTVQKLDVVVVGAQFRGVQLHSAAYRSPVPFRVDGRVLFQRATERFLARQAGRPIDEPAGGLGDIVMMPSVREARDRGALDSVRPFVRFTETGVIWPEGNEMRVDAVIWCTGFGYALEHLAPLGIIEPDGTVAVQGTRSVREPRLWLLGYGEWSGEASATILGVGRYARSTVAEITRVLRAES